MDRRPTFAAMTSLVVVTVGLCLGYLTVAAQEPSSTIYFPFINNPTLEFAYDLIGDADSESPWSSIQSTFSEEQVFLSRRSTSIGIEVNEDGKLRKVADVSCTGEGCDTDGEASTEGIDTPDDFEIVIAIDGTKSLLLRLETSQRLRVQIINNGVTLKTTIFTCKTGTCRITLTQANWATPTTTPAPISIESFVLVNADTDQDIRVLNNADTIDLAVNPRITIRAQPKPTSVGSVQFYLDNSTTYPDGTLRRENAAPYSLNGDSNGNFNPWNPSLGSHTVGAIAYTGSNGTGTASAQKTITVNIVNNGPGGTGSTPTPTSTPANTSQPAPTPTNPSQPTPTPTNTTQPGPAPELSYVFVSRQIPSNGSIYWDVPKDLPGVGPHSRFRVASPGKLMVLQPNGQTRVLVDGANPTAASLNLIDVNAPDVSYDGTTIVFAGLPQGNYDKGTITNPGEWRLYVIKADGTGLRQVTFSDMNLNYSQFGNAAGQLEPYDDTDPAWLPDGRIVFSSTRWPSFAQYSGVRTSNLYIVNADGKNLHRITSERNGADRPVVDPVTGKIVFARWWRNHRFAVDSMTTIAESNGGYLQKDGLTTNRSNHLGGGDFLWRNQWHPAVINPDGTGIAQWGGTHHKLDSSHMYGGSFNAAGDLIANYYPMANMTESGGFGGLRLYKRGPGNYTPLLGITYMTLDYVNPSNPTSYGIFKGSYATDAEALPDGRMVLSWAKDINQDYGLYIANANGSGLTLLYDNPGTTEVRVKVLAPRPVPPVIADQITQVASQLPPTSSGAYTQDGTFTFNALNVYFNGPVDGLDASAPPVGSAAKIRFFADFQRTSPGSYPAQDWPILLGERTVEADGSVIETTAPANLPLFEQIRTAQNTVPFTPGDPDGAAHVAGMNYGRPGENMRCVGCHAGHTMIQLPATDEAAQWTNLAPGAQVRVSSSRDANQNGGLIDRRVMKGEIWRYWVSASGQTQNQWVELVFPVPVTVRTVRLYNPRSGDEANSSIQVQGVNVRLYSDAAATTQVASQSGGQLSVSGTDVNFADVKARVVRIEITGVTGTFYGSRVASLAEVEVIARGEAAQ